MGKTLTGPELAAMRSKAASNQGVNAQTYDQMLGKWQRVYDELAAMLTDHFDEQPAAAPPPACLHANTVTTPVRNSDTDEVKHWVHCQDCGKTWWGEQ